MTFFFENKKDFKTNSLLVFVLILLCIYKVFTIVDFNLEYYDSDQFIMWLSARLFSQGEFYGPCFYGQDYNYMIEGFLAAPLLYFGMDVRMAVAWATQFLFSSVWIINALIIAKHKSLLSALLFLSIWMLLPLEYDLLTALPRGFVPAFACCSALMWTLIKPQHKTAFALNTVLSACACTINPTTAWISFPVLAYAWIKSKTRYFILLPACVALITAGIWYMQHRYYSLHPDYIVHPQAGGWSWDYFKMNIARLNLLIFLTGPMWPGLGILWFLLFLIFIWVYRRQQVVLWTLLFTILLFALFLFHFKIGDGLYHWLFFSNSRFFIGLPLVLALYGSISDVFCKSLWAKLLITIAMVNMGFKIYCLKNQLESHFSSQQWFGVHVFKKNELEHAIAEIQKVIIAQNANGLVLSGNQWQDELFAYAAPAVLNRFCETRLTSSFGGHAERRYWLKKKHNKIYKGNLLYLSSNFNLTAPTGFNAVQWTPINRYGLYRIVNTNYSLNELVNRLDSAEIVQAKSK